MIASQGLPGGTATIRGDISSQFLSGLLMAAPYAQRRVELLLDGPLVSQPYVHMTRHVMQAFGVQVEDHALQRFTVDAPTPLPGPRVLDRAGRFRRQLLLGRRGHHGRMRHRDRVGPTSAAGGRGVL